jgi:hypothetical protein
MLLTEEQQLIQTTARQFAEENLKPHSATWAKTHHFPSEILKPLAALGFCGMLVPEKWHGSNIGHVAYALVMEEIAAGDGSTSTILSVHNTLGCGSLLQYGTESQKQTYLKPLAKGEKLAAFCLTEPQAGSDAANLKTTAVYSPGYYLLNGTKQFITSGKHADVAIVFAVTDFSQGKHGISAFVVPTGLPGYQVSHIEEKMGQEAAETVQLTFENLKVPAENLLGNLGDGYKIALSQLESGRIGIAAQCVGMARAAYEAALQYSKERITFEKPLFDHQAIAFRLADMATQIEAARQLTLHAATREEQKLPCLKEAAMAKLFASEMAEKVCCDAIQIYGGYGYLQDFPVERIYRDVRATSLYEGTSDIQRILISRSL